MVIPNKKNCNIIYGKLSNYKNPTLYIEGGEICYFNKLTPDRVRVLSTRIECFEFYKSVLEDN